MKYILSFIFSAVLFTVIAVAFGHTLLPSTLEVLALRLICFYLLSCSPLMLLFSEQIIAYFQAKFSPRPESIKRYLDMQCFYLFLKETRNISVEESRRFNQILVEMTPTEGNRYFASVDDAFMVHLLNKLNGTHWLIARYLKDFLEKQQLELLFITKEV